MDAVHQLTSPTTLNSLLRHWLKMSKGVWRKLPPAVLMVTGRKRLGVLSDITELICPCVFLSYAASKTYKCCEETLMADKRITRFMLLLGTHVNMDGTVLYEMAATLFIAQLSGLTLHWSKILSIG